MLVLNADNTPINMTSFKKGYKLVHKGRAEVVATEVNHLMHTEKLDIERPVVIRLHKYVNLPYKKITLSKSNIFKRDFHTCVYCGSKENLTIDHVIPKSKGGKNTWDNLVTSCFPCNHRKGSKSLEDSGLKMVAMPLQPTYMNFITKEQLDKIQIKY
jgi:5-methylcytosine-specific restriction endonuclease McrA